MKKFLLTILFLFFAVTSAKAVTNYFDVTFDEFCPPDMVDIDTSKEYGFLDNGPWTQYWASRKKHFEQRKSYCLQQQEKDECLKQLRDYERYQSLLVYSSGKSIYIKDCPGYGK